MDPHGDSERRDVSENFEARFSIFPGRERGNPGKRVDRDFRGTRGGLNPPDVREVAHETWI